MKKVQHGRKQPLLVTDCQVELLREAENDKDDYDSGDDDDD